MSCFYVQEVNFQIHPIDLELTCFLYQVHVIL